MTDFLEHDFSIRKSGNPILRERAKEVTRGFPELKTLIDKMAEIIVEEGGIGLAAPQVGLSLRVFLIRDEEDNIRHYVNPEILDTGLLMNSFEEGCLSIDDKVGKVSRPMIIKAKWCDSNLEEFIGELDIYHSRIFQHEFDHLEGVLFTDYL